jgi:hypothetical protein
LADDRAEARGDRVAAGATPAERKIGIVRVIARDEPEPALDRGGGKICRSVKQLTLASAKRL